MFKKLKALLQGVATQLDTSRQRELELFIKSKNPTCTADLEQLVRTYERSLRSSRYGY